MCPTSLLSQQPIAHRKLPLPLLQNPSPQNSPQNQLSHRHLNPNLYPPNPYPPIQLSLIHLLPLRSRLSPSFPPMRKAGLRSKTSRLRQSNQLDRKSTRLNSSHLGIS